MAGRRMLYACEVHIQDKPLQRNEKGQICRKVLSLEVAGRSIADVTEAINEWATRESSKVLQLGKTTTLHKAGRREPPGFVRVLEETIVWT